MTIREHFSLRPYNTFGITAAARWFAEFTDPETLAELCEWSLSQKTALPPLILGGGSNVLFTGDYDGPVLLNRIGGIDIVKEDDRHVYVKVGAGENWHHFVMHCLGRNWAGVENLSLIPGCVGASPMQNIGAYGVEIKDVFEGLEAYHLREGHTHLFTLSDCAFGYRDSIFKHRLKGELAITSVTFRLNKIPSLHTEYGAIREELEKMQEEPTIHSISRAVIRIRSSKLPDPAQIGNAGSFFKNPTVSARQFGELRAEFPLIPGYPQEDSSVKLAAGWLIEQCGWKGYRHGDAGCHSRQALVLVNYGKATGQDILNLSDKIQKSILEKFEVMLEREVNII